MNILISGGSGFLGSALTQELINNPLNSENTGEKTTVTWLSRHANTKHPDGVQILTYDDLKTTSPEKLPAFDIIINLAGAGIADSRWTDARKKELFDSRLQPTQAIINYLERISIARMADKPKLLISGSAIGWYGAYKTEEENIALSENSPPRQEFQHDLCEQWEALAKSAQNYDVPVTIVRTGVVIAPNGGMVVRLITPFKMYAGGNLGNGKQIMSWISRDDWVRAVRFIIEKNINPLALSLSKGSDSDFPMVRQAHHERKIESPQIYNLTHPNPVTNAEFTKAMGEWLHRPTFATMPSCMVKAMFGEMATLLLDGQKIVPKNLLDSGFEFKDNTVLQALQS